MQVDVDVRVNGGVGCCHDGDVLCVSVCDCVCSNGRTNVCGCCN